MKKEALTLANVKTDLMKVVRHRLSVADEWRFSFIVPFSMLAVLLGFLLQSVGIGIIVVLPAVYHLIFYIKAVREYKEEKRLVCGVVERGDLAISEEKFDHISEEERYEPHRGRNMIYGSHRTAHATRVVSIFHFKAGGTWRPPKTRRHYEWSPEYHLTSSGLKNTAVEGNVYYRISVQGYFDISYIYPANFFTLSEDLKKSTTLKGENND